MIINSDFITKFFPSGRIVNKAQVWRDRVVILSVSILFVNAASLLVFGLIDSARLINRLIGPETLKAMEVEPNFFTRPLLTIVLLIGWVSFCFFLVNKKHREQGL